MKKILKLIELYNKYNKHTRYHYITLYSDWAGTFNTYDEEEIFRFSSREDLLDKLKNLMIVCDKCGAEKKLKNG